MLQSKLIQNSKFKIQNLGFTEGFTLIELLIATALVAIVGIGIATLAYFYSQTAQSFRKDILSNSIELRHRLTLRDMSETIRASKGVIASSTISGTTYSTATTTLVLDMFSLDASSSPIAGDDIVVYNFDNTKKTVQKIVSPGIGSLRRNDNSTLTNLADNLSFSYDNPNLSAVKKITITLTSKKSAGNLTATTSDTINISLR